PALAAWENSFPPSSVASYFHGLHVSLIVVGAGGDARDAVDAFTSAARASRRFELVMTGDGLGDVSKLDDATIVSRCGKLPVNHVAIVRVFPGQALTAVRQAGHAALGAVGRGRYARGLSRG